MNLIAECIDDDRKPSSRMIALTVCEGERKLNLKEAKKRGQQPYRPHTREDLVCSWKSERHLGLGRSGLGRSKTISWEVMVPRNNSRVPWNTCDSSSKGWFLGIHGSVLGVQWPTEVFLRATSS